MIVSRRYLSAVSVLVLAIAIGAPAIAQEVPQTPRVPAPVQVPTIPVEVAPTQVAPAQVSPTQAVPQSAEPESSDQDASDPDVAEPVDEGEDGEGPGLEIDTDAPPVRAEITPIPAVWAPVPLDDDGRSAYGLYLGGRYLVGRGNEIEGDATAGAAVLGEALTLTPEQPNIAEQAFVAALLAGDLETAVRSRPHGTDVSPTLTGAGRLVRAVMDFDQGASRQAAALLKARPVDPPHATAALLVQPWIAAAARDWDMALTPPPEGTNTLFLVMRLQRAQILEMRRRYDEAETDYRALVEAPNSQPAFRAAYGEFLERRRRRDEAVALYAAASPTDASNPLLILGRTRAASGGRAPRLPTYRMGAARALLLASSLARDMGANQFAAVYSRLALQLEPNDNQRLHYADTLIRARLEARGREILAEVGPQSPGLYTTAQAQLAESLARDGRDDESVAAYRRAVAASPLSIGANLALAGQLVALKRNQEAIELLDGPVLSVPEQTPVVHFMRGAAYEGVGRIEAAEQELQAAVTGQPTNPMFMNFLGYLWVDSGLKVNEGADMIARAFGAQPTDGNIQDSLGWAHYHLGGYELAVETLEAAVAKEPANAEINDHLGDAYWRVGRRREAVWQWNRVLTLDPDDERRAVIESKLVGGLPESEPLSRHDTPPLDLQAAPGADAT